MKTVVKMFVVEQDEEEVFAFWLQVCKTFFLYKTIYAICTGESDCQSTLRASEVVYLSEK